MSEMVERAARAIVAWRSPFLASDEHWPRMADDYWSMCREYAGYADGRSLITDAFRDARAALEALREPTPEMIAACHGALKPHIDALSEEARAAAKKKVLTGGYFVNRDTKAALRWRAMIDAALQPRPAKAGDER